MRITRRHDEKGTSAVELVLYMPLLMIAIILTVQFALVYLANQVVSASAREASRVARVTGNANLGQDKGVEYAGNLGGGVIDSLTVVVQQIGDTDMRATVIARAPAILPFFESPQVREEVQGPIERFVQDEG